MGEQTIAFAVAARHGRCVLLGWPTVTGRSVSATVTATRTHTTPALAVSSADVSRLVVRAGRPAYVLLWGSDRLHNGDGCAHSFTRYRFLLPHDGGVIVAAVPQRLLDYTMCGQFAATPFVPAADVIAKQR